MDIGVVLSTFLLVFVAELGDKSQLISFSLTGKGRSPFTIFIASAAALILSSLLATLFGGYTSSVIPRFADTLSALLFIGFGAYTVFSAEPPMIKQCFLEAIVTEEKILKALPKIAGRDGRHAYHVLNVVRQEKSHANVLQHLLREKKLFRDDINEDQRFAGILEDVSLDRDLCRMPFDEAIDELIRKEKAVITLFRFLHEHLGLEHHYEPSLQEILLKLIEEEEEHVALYRFLKEERVTCG